MSSTATDVVADWSEWLRLCISSLVSSVSGNEAAASSSSTSISATLSAIFFPPLPPWVATLCFASRVISVCILAPIILISAIDFAEYVVFRTLGIRRRKIRIKQSHPLSSTSPSSKDRFRLSPAQFKVQSAAQSTPAPLLPPGAYDAETLLRHRARSNSAASAEALDEWQRTGGSFARVAEVRQAASSSGIGSDISKSGYSFDSTSTSSKTTTDTTPSHFGVEGAMGLSESEAEDSGPESAPGSPTIGFRSGSNSQRQGLRGSKFIFTPVEERSDPMSAAAAAGPRHRRSGSAASNSSLDKKQSTSGLPLGLVEESHDDDAENKMAAAADLEPEWTTDTSKQEQGSSSNYS